MTSVSFLVDPEEGKEPGSHGESPVVCGNSALFGQPPESERS